MRLVITFDPIDGTTCPDGRVDQFADDVCERYSTPSHNQLDPMRVNIGNALMLTAIRMRIKEGIIPSENVIVEFKNEALRIDREGKFMDFSPDGFCDHAMKMHAQLAKRS